MRQVKFWFSLVAILCVLMQPANASGCGWKLQPGATYSSGVATLRGMAAQSATAAWAVGYYSPTPTGLPILLTEYWNGTSWFISNPPQRSTLGHYFYGGALIGGTSQYWAVGYNDEAAHPTLEQTLVERYDGTSWNIVSSPNVNFSTESNYLFGIDSWGLTSALAVGQTFNTKTGHFSTLGELWNGTNWKIVPTPNVSSIEDFFNGVGGISATNAWAVGSAFNGSRLVPITAHWNGVSWNNIAIPAPSTTNNSYLYSVTAISAHDVWADGYYQTGAGNGRTLAYHWNGIAWSMSTTKNPVGSYGAYLFGASHTATNDVWLAGSYKKTMTGPFFTLAEHWNGATWSIVPTQNPASGDNVFNSISAVDPLDVFAAGGQNSTSTMVQAYCR